MPKRQFCFEKQQTHGMGADGGGGEEGGGADTSIIFVATDRSFVATNKHNFVAINFCRDKIMFVETNMCRDKHNFIATTQEALCGGSRSEFLFFPFARIYFKVSRPEYKIVLPQQTFNCFSSTLRCTQ